MQQKNQLRHPRLSKALIVDWARAHFKQFGRWPAPRSGLVVGVPGLTWAIINNALYAGYRGLPGGESLAILLRQRAGKTLRLYKPVISREQVIAWAREHFSRTGRWPSATSGRVIGAHDATWKSIDDLLRKGFRGLPGGLSLSRLLDEVIGVSRRWTRPPLTIRQIVDWANRHHRRTGVWPTPSSGPIQEAPGEKWQGVQFALQRGKRGLPGGDTLPRVLNRYCGRPLGPQRRRIPVSRVLAWADAYYRRCGRWPTVKSGLIKGAGGLSWSDINDSLRHGDGTIDRHSLAGLLCERRGRSASVRSIELDVQQVLRWADLHHDRTGRWPMNNITRLVDGIPLTWAAIARRLRAGRVRGVAKGTTLTELLIKQRGAKIRLVIRSPLTVRQVLGWASAHHRQTGKWPTCVSGPIRAVPGDTWDAVHSALRDGRRGLPKGSTLARLLNQIRGESRDLARKRPLKLHDVILWARAYYRRTRQWPNKYDGRVDDAKGETWFGIDEALRLGARGLAGGSSLNGLVRGLRRPHAIRLGHSRHRGAAAIV